MEKNGLMAVVDGHPALSFDLGARLMYDSSQVVSHAKRVYY